MKLFSSCRLLCLACILISATAGAQAPVFTNAPSVTITFCFNDPGVSIDGLLEASYAQTGTTLTWSVSSGPAHGSADGFPATATSNGGAVTPAGLSYTPGNGYSGTDAFTIEVTDGSSSDFLTINVQINPEIILDTVLTNITCAADVNGAIDLSVSGGTPGYTYLWSNLETTEDISGLGRGTYTVVVEDFNGCTATLSADMMAQDLIPPVAVCKSFDLYLDATGNATLDPFDIDNGSSDNCIDFNLDAFPFTFTCAEVGVNTVTLTVTDVSGNTATCDAAVTVIDTISPVVSCQGITIQLDATGNASITAADIDNGSTDACGITSSTLDISAFDCNNVGPNTITLTVTDVNGNTSTCTATVTVEDNIAPVANCQNITVQLDAFGTATITAGQVDNGSTDACGIAIPSLDITDFDCTDIGPNTVTLTVSDFNGNSSSCTATVTIEDNVPPAANCQNLTVQLDITGHASITAAQIDNGSTDACGIASTGIDITDFDCSNVGANIVTLTVTDVNGNPSTCAATVTVTNNVAPTANCRNITVQLDATGNATITAAQIDNGSIDDCGIASMALDISAFDCNNLGANTVTLTVTDAGGNTSTCTATVTVEDNIAPVANCQNITMQLDAFGNATISAGQVDNGSTDACGVSIHTLDITDFDCSDVGPNTVTLIVSDFNGNSSSCTATVTVEDNVPPAAACQNITVQLDATGNASIAASQIDNGSTDACGIASTTLDVTSFDCSNVGANTVTLTVTDIHGNTSTCTATVTVEDNVAPVANCQNITVQLDATGNTSVTAIQIDNGSTDACGVASTALDITAFDCSNIGANTVTLTVTDVNGNTSTCSATVTVEDHIAPVANCQNITLQLDATGTATITALDIDNGSTDACGIASTSLDVTDFDCSDIGTNTVTLTVTDNNGNTSTCVATVTIEDNDSPNVICQPVTVQLDATGNVSITAAQIDNGSTDACGILSMSLTPDHFNCSNIGANTVTLTVTDVNGNSANCTAVVTVTGNSSAGATTNITRSVCAGGSYAFGGQSLTSSGTYYDTLASAGGCDSVVILHLTVLPAAASTTTATICSGTIYAFNGQQLTASGTYVDTVTNGNGCDSIVTLNLTVQSQLTQSVMGVLCPGTPYFFFGQPLLTPGTYTHVVHAPNGCDTLVTLTLSNTMVNNDATVLGMTCTASQNGATYQWYTCNTGQLIPGATSQTYVATTPGRYQCLVTYGGCSVATNCVNALSFPTAIAEISDYNFSLYPNPNNGSFVIKHDYSGTVTMTIDNVLGQRVRSVQAATNTQYFDISDMTAGVYWVVIADGDIKLATIKVVKQ